MSEPEDGLELSSNDAVEALGAALKSIGWKCPTDECGALNAPSANRCEVCGSSREALVPGQIAGRK